MKEIKWQFLIDDGERAAYLDKYPSLMLSVTCFQSNANFAHSYDMPLLDTVGVENGVESALWIWSQ